MILLMKPGDTLGNRYQIRSPIGAGGAACVFLAFDPVMEREVAVKMFRPDDLGVDETAEQFHCELNALGRLEHPHILPIYDSGTQEDVPFLVMRYADRGSFKDEIQRELPTMDRIFTVFFQVGRALAYSHHHGMLHRDVKPSNILVEESGDVYMADFSLAIIKDDPTATAASMRTRGTASYMAPEQWFGDPLTTASDVYSLSASLFEAVTGAAPFADTSPQKIMTWILTKAPPSPADVNPDLPAQLVETICKGMAKDPAERYHTPLQLVAALKKVMATSR